ncbi:MAG: peptidoglycan-binding protein [Archangiaceae bacterium]|nr:peptidoglycan-binding protein [Archangiaceae bacterium]
MSKILEHRVTPSQVKDVRDDLSAIAAAVKGTESLAPGSSGPAVEALQRRLRGIGAYDGPVNGQFDAATQEAVKQLQLAKGLTADGSFDGAELTALRGQELFVKSNFETLARVGQKGSDILAVEKRLDALGYDTGKVDGVMDQKTLAAVLKLRKADSTVPDKGNVIGHYVNDALKHTVKQTELNLKLLGRDAGKVDTVFTKDTARAIRGFQRKNHLTVTGEADAKTRAALNKAAATAGRFPQTPSSQFMHGYDLSHWQSDATFSSLLNKPSTRFMAIKATDGVSGTDSTFKKRWAAMGKKLEPGKFDLRIAYHFLQPGNGRAQADHFLKTLGIHGKLQPGTRLALDWEASSLSSPSALKDAAKRIHEVTGTWPLIYCSASNIGRAHSLVPNSPIWDAHWSPTSADWKFPFVQTGIKNNVDQDVFTGSELALRKWAGWF